MAEPVAEDGLSPDSSEIPGIDAEGVWMRVGRPQPDRAEPVPALFLDRDGVIVEDVHHLRRHEDARLIPGAARLIATANRLDVPVVVVTNQSGVGHGYLDWQLFLSIEDHIEDMLRAEGAAIDAIVACPHHPEARPPFGHPDHPARKPNIGMLERAAAALSLDLSRSWIIGDKASDVEAGLRGGLAGAIHVAQGHGVSPRERSRALRLATARFVVVAAETTADAFGRLPLLD